MLVDFNTLPDTSRVWIYQANRILSNEEVVKITEKLKNFVANWKRHGEDLKASFQLKYNQFIILGVDENFNDVSGCSIDASVHIIKQIQQEFEVDLLNKMNIAFKDGSNINIITMNRFKEFVTQNKINTNTIVFNNMVNSKEQLLNNWEVEAGNSWHARFLN